MAFSLSTPLFKSILAYEALEHRECHHPNRLEKRHRSNYEGFLIILSLITSFTKFYYRFSRC